MLQMIRLDVVWILSRVGLRPKVPFGFRLRAGRRLFSFTRPRLGSRPNTLGAVLEPCLGFSLDVGCISGKQVPLERAGFVSGFAMGSGCALSVLMGSTPLVIGSTLPVTSEVDAVQILTLAC